MYAAYLARFLVPSSVCIYLNFVGILHKEYGLNNPLLDNWTLSTVLRGIKREKGAPPVPKLPITHDILSFIHSQLNLRDSKQASFWAICLVSFFGLFRKSHLLPPSPKEFSPGTYLTRSDFTFRDSTLLIQVRWSKTFQFGQRIVTVPLVALLPSVFCPVTAVSRAFSLTSGSPPSSQAFCWWDSYYASYRVFTYRDFMACLKSHLSRSGLPPGQYGSHSFRRGGATFALEGGVPLDSIAVMGDWKSDAMYLYLHMPLSQRLFLSEILFILFLSIISLINYTSLHAIIIHFRFYLYRPMISERFARISLLPTNKLVGEDWIMRTGGCLVCWWRMN